MKNELKKIWAEDMKYYKTGEYWLLSAITVVAAAAVMAVIPLIDAVNSSAAEIVTSFVAWIFRPFIKKEDK